MFMNIATNYLLEKMINLPQTWASKNWHYQNTLQKWIIRNSTCTIFGPYYSVLPFNCIFVTI